MTGIVVKCCVIALVTALIALVLKEMRLEWSGILGLLGCVVLILAAISMFEQILTSISSFVMQSGLDREEFTAIAKCTGITFLVDFVSGFCRGQGQISLATAVETIGRISVCVLAIPFALELLGLANQILSA